MRRFFTASASTTTNSLTIPRPGSKAHQSCAGICGTRDFGVRAAATVAREAGDALRRARRVLERGLRPDVSALILLLLLFLPLDGKPHADWLQFLGRFHPLLVHLPIGLIVLLPVLETFGDQASILREAAGVVLQFALATCLVAILFGLLLAYGSGEIGTTVTSSPARRNPSGHRAVVCAWRFGPHGCRHGNHACIPSCSLRF